MFRFTENKAASFKGAFQWFERAFGTSRWFKARLQEAASKLKCDEGWRDWTLLARLCFRLTCPSSAALVIVRQR